ncbi:unnamed protein product [Cunninghamella blakesleeana]
MVNNMEGRVVDDLNAATHIIYNNDDPIFDPEQPRPFQEEEKQNSRVLLHYFGLPSSYDSWVNEGEYNNDLARPVDPSLQSSPWHLKVSWIKDSYTYNEWMNTADYHYPDYKLYYTNSLSSLKRSIKDGVTDSHDSPSKKVKSSDEDGNVSSISPSQQQIQENGDNHSTHLNTNQQENNIKEGNNIDTNENTMIKDEPAEAVMNSNEINNNDSNNSTNNTKNNNNNSDNDDNDNDSVNENDDMKNEDKNNANNDGNNEKENDNSNNNIDSNNDNDNDMKNIFENHIAKFQSVQAHDVIIPSYASWFEINSVNEIEYKSLPEFFDSKSKYKTPTVYKTYRDFMINSYRVNPFEYLTITACRRNLMGDACSIIRVHSFLEQWGLINYQVDPNFKSNSFNVSEDQQLRLVQSKSIMSRSSPPLSSTDLNRNNDVVEELDNNIIKSEENRKDDDSMKMDIDKKVTPPSSPISSSKKEDNDSTMNTSEIKDENKSKSESTSITCTTCKTENLKIWYKHYQKKDIYLCESCLLDGKYSIELNSSEFIKELIVDDNKETPWTEEEKKLLLEGLDKYHDDWNKISDHVKTRTRDQCILYYLQLPTENPYTNTKLSDLGMLQLDRSDFPPPSSSSNDINTIFATVTFLASTVKPEVAAAAATASDCKPIHYQSLKNISSSSSPSEKNTDKENKDTAEVTSSSSSSSSTSLPSSKETELRDTLYQLIRNKMEHFKIKITQYEEKESLLEEERRKLEKERFQLSQDQIHLQETLQSIRQEIIKQGGDQQENNLESNDNYDDNKMNVDNNSQHPTSSPSNYQNTHHIGMTPAEIQQKLAAAAAANGPTNRSMIGNQQQQQMFLNSHQPPNFMQQRLQQQQQIQLQMQMQQQQQGGNQSNQPQNFNMMSL